MPPDGATQYIEAMHYRIANLTKEETDATNKAILAKHAKERAEDELAIFLKYQSENMV